MTPEETITLIADMSEADPRMRRDDPTEHAAQIATWFQALADVPYDFAVGAAKEHYAASQWPIAPNAVTERWKTHLGRRAERWVDPVPAADPDNPAAYLAELKATRSEAWTDVTPVRPPRAALGPGAPQVAAAAALAYAEDDVAAMRQQGDLRRVWQGACERAHGENARRRGLVLAHPDLAKRLTQPPLNYATPELWSGYVPGDDTWQGGRNTAPTVTALRALLDEAIARAV